MRSKYIHIILLPLLLLLFAQTAFADEAKQTGDSTTLAKPEDNFDVKDFTFMHILDSYEFHITNIGETVISVPLPVIVKSKDRGWFVFMSSKLHHGASSYKGFSVAKEGEPYAYKIVETLPNGTTVRPLDLSITKAVFSLFVAIIILCSVFLPIAKRYKRNPLKAPSGLQSLLEPIVLFVLNDVIKSVLGDAYRKYVPYLLTIFFFLLLLNFMGMIPIFPFGANVTGNIVIPMVLAACTYVIINVSSTKTYWKDVFWTPGTPTWLKVPVPIMPFIEFLSTLTKPIVLMIRLFANMMAGHLIIIVMMSLIFIFGAMSAIIADTVTIIAILLTIFMTILHILIAIIQAYVFTLLSAVFISMARIKHEEHKK